MYYPPADLLLAYPFASRFHPPDVPVVGGDGWAHIREAQRKCLTIPHTGMAVTTDVGDADDIHPRNKADVGDRLARWALANEYGKTVVPSGPLFRGLKIDGNKAVVEFDHVGAELMVGRKGGRKPVDELKDGKLARFAIAGKDKKWVWADAKVAGHTVVCPPPTYPTRSPCGMPLPRIPSAQTCTTVTAFPPCRSAPTTGNPGA